MPAKSPVDLLLCVGDLGRDERCGNCLSWWAVYHRNLTEGDIVEADDM
jgi:hypothetical protein